ncbi:MAG: carbon-nitrogen hydrolase family protein [Deltaproteobacteria bacterium]|nr:carbon-nitrogen hydrolase family protein [Deltaproteobacteria bacterium]MBW1986024.1 carbon-nitrogen hydrolase family protein [Deltaproteobacteria bacterium]MBW2134814.1 carbon-nitrogen hydrolase family protein [Deltaproteobacteria bacterium]
MWVALVQMHSTTDIEHNRLRARQLIQEAARRGARLVALPEHFAYLGPREEENLPTAQPLDGPLVQEFRQLAAELGIYLLLGTFPEIAAPGPKPYNTSVLLGPQGNLLAYYRKIHLFDITLPGRTTYQESRYVQSGQKVVTASLSEEAFTIGLAICYDLRFPELFRFLVDQGAEVIILPAAFTLHTGKDHWEVLLRARAIENQVYILAPAQFGQHGPQRESYGRSMVVDPWGLMLAQAPDGEGVIYAWLERERLQRVRAHLPSLQHRRLPVAGLEASTVKPRP